MCQFTVLTTDGSPKGERGWPPFLQAKVTPREPIDDPAELSKRRILYKQMEESMQ